jgi:hypothetical protein
VMVQSASEHGSGCGSRKGTNIFDLGRCSMIRVHGRSAGSTGRTPGGSDTSGCGCGCGRSGCVSGSGGSWRHGSCWRHAWCKLGQIGCQSTVVKHSRCDGLLTFCAAEGCFETNLLLSTLFCDNMKSAMSQPSIRMSGSVPCSRPS